MPKMSAYNDFSTADTKGYAKSDIINPYVSGYYYLVWVRKPTGVIGDGDGQVPNEFFDDISRVLNTGITFPGATLNTTKVTTSFSNASKASTPTSIERDNSITIKYSEMSGMPIITNTEKWVFSIRDPLTGLSSVANYSLKNISGDLLVVLTKPVLSDVADSQDEGFIERAYLYTNVYPTNIPDDALSPDLETQDKVTLDITYDFTNCITGANVNALAEKKIVGKVIKTTSYDQVDVEV